MRCVRCEDCCCHEKCEPCESVCEVCGCNSLVLKCKEHDEEDGCIKAIFWGFLAFITIGIALFIPLLFFKDKEEKECVFVCRNCGHIQGI